MRNFVDLILASTTTLLFGTLFLYLSLGAPFAGSATIGTIGLLVSFAAGPIVLWLRGTQPFIPIASTFCVLMFIVYLFVGFDIAWRLGMVDL